MRLSLACWLAAGVFLAPAMASAACSASVGVPSFTVAVKDPPVHYRLDLDSASLAQIAGDNGMAGLRGEIPFGLTIGRYDLEITVETNSLRDGAAYCAQLHSAHVEIGLKQLDVIVDRRFVEGSCQRQVVLDHESQHVEVFREAIRYYLPAIQRTLIETPMPLNTRVAGREEARAAFLVPITNALKPVFAAINERARDGNARLDAPDSYAAVFKRCSHW